MRCFNCDEPGHMAWECGFQGMSTANPLRRRPAAAVANPHAWAEKIRAALGWAPGSSLPGHWRDLRAVAAAQVTEARAGRG